MKIYLVGGAIRDQLLNIPVTERDYVVVGSTPQEMLQLGYKQVGRDFPVFLHPLSHEEYALARIERKVGPGYLGFTCYSAPDVTLEEDLKRRDLTINAMAMDLDGQLIDPYHGQSDLKSKILRHISPAFSEDPVRVLRVARFMARYSKLGFSIAPETLQLMRDMVTHGEINALIPERVWSELQKALTEPTPSEFIATLRACDALRILFQPLDDLFKSDLGIHALNTLIQATQLSQQSIVRFAALCHDLSPASLIQLDRYPIPKKYKELALMVINDYPACHLILKQSALTCVLLLEKLDAFRRPERFNQWLSVCEADFKARMPTSPYPQADFMREILEVAKGVTLNSSGLNPQSLKDALRRLRIEAVQTYQSKDH
jgi:tRNA nucleotidyltransferase (CCA-adding enzyme)